MEPAEIYSLIANILMIVVLGTYLWKVKVGITIPNKTTWIIWLMGMVLNTPSYSYVVGGNLIELMLSITVTLGMFVIFTYSWIKDKFAEPDKTDKRIRTALALALVAAVFWRATGSAVVANIIAQFVLFVAFWPTARGLLKNTLRDHPLPWGTALVAYFFQILTVISDPEGWVLQELIFPIMNGIIGNGSVLLIILQKRKTWQ